VISNIKVERKGKGNKVSLYLDGTARPHTILPIGIHTEKEGMFGRSGIGEAWKGSLHKV
jgi:hypothetical protein